MATLGVKWRQTEEFVRAEFRAMMYHEDLKLPAKEFEYLKTMLLRRIGTMMRVYTHKPVLNNPMARFLWVLFDRLDAGQRGEILLADSKNVIQAWRENISVHTQELAFMADRKNWLRYWSIQNYLLHVRGIGSMDDVVLLDAFEQRAIYLEYASDPRYAYCNNCAIQWTGCNVKDIDRYYGGNFSFYKKGTDLTIITSNGPLTLKHGDWTWPDTGDGIDGGDITHLMVRKLETGQPGIWFKPGSTIIGS